MKLNLINWKTFVIAGIILLSLETLGYGQGAAPVRAAITNITLDPPTPNTLIYRKRVGVSFSYTAPEPVRISVVPFAKGSIVMTSRFRVRLVPAGNDWHALSFTVDSGNVLVDQIRIRMWNSNRKVLFQTFVTVSYQFRAP